MLLVGLVKKNGAAAGAGAGAGAGAVADAGDGDGEATLVGTAGLPWAV